MAYSLKTKLKARQMFALGETLKGISLELKIPWRTVSKWVRQPALVANPGLPTPVYDGKKKGTLESITAKVEKELIRERLDILERTEQIIEGLDTVVMAKMPKLGPGEAARSADYYFKRKQLIQERPTLITKNLEQMSDDELKKYIEGEFTVIEENRTLAQGQIQAGTGSPERGGENPLLDSNSKAGELPAGKK